MSMLRIGVLGGLRASRHPAITPHFLSRSASSLHRQSFTQLQVRKAPSLSLIPFQFHQRRTTASSVSGKPGSSDIRHAIQNAKEEAHGVTVDLAKIIAAANFDQRKHGLDGFSDITAGLAAEVPKPILLTGLAGAIPYIFTAGSTLYAARAAGLLAAGHAARVEYDTAIQVLEAAAHIQVTYGAVMLSFLGALHWGMEFAGYGYRRLALGVAPVIFAWSTLALDPTMALIAQWAGFTGMWYADMRATTAGWTPAWYSQYRFYLSILIGTCIIITLWGENYFNPVIETTTFSSSVANTTEPASSATSEHLASGGKFSGTSDQLGEIETIEGDDYYVLLKKKETEEESEGEGEGEGEGKAAEESPDSDNDSDESAKEHVEKSKGDQAKKDENQNKGKAGDIRSNKSKA